jgi:hypothetical protein
VFKNWIRLTVADCEVIEMEDGMAVYPIFKNGRSSIHQYALAHGLKKYYNHDISKLKNIVLYMREPEERFVSGVYTYLYYKNSQKVDEKILSQIENFKVIDQHFAPQYIWLLHLYKYYNGLVDIRPVSEAYNLVPVRGGPWDGELKGPWKPLSDDDKVKISKIKHSAYVDVDKKIIKKYIGKKVDLKQIIKEFKNAVS